MNPLIKRVKTQQEKDELLRQARAEWEKIPGEVKHLVAASDEEFIGKIADSIVVESLAFVQPRELTKAELGRMDGELMHEQWYGFRRDAGTGIPAIDNVVKANEEHALQKLLGPGQRSKNALQTMIDSAIEEAVATFRKSATTPRRESDRTEIGILPRTEGVSSTHRTNSGGRIEVNGNDCTEYAADGRFLRCWIGAPSDRPPFESLAA